MRAIKLRDIILVAIAGVLAVFILLPDRKTEPEEKTQPLVIPSAAEKTIEENQDNSNRFDSSGQNAAVSTSTVEGVFHPYWPLIPGNVWIYRTEGPDRFVPANTWTMELISKPEKGVPGKIKVGFGEKLSEANVWVEGETMRLDGLPLIEPIEFMNNRPISMSGAFLPTEAQMGEDAVWTYDFESNVIYQFLDNRGRLQTAPAQAKQKERALVQGKESIITPAGKFDTWKILWISRIEINSNGRPVLKDLTSEPFRRETMWIAKGVGIVRRNIDYSGYRGANVVFDLLKFKHSETARTD